MLKKEFQKELDKLSELNGKYQTQLNKVVDKLEKEFGKTPYEIDCDYFIDSYCVGNQNMTVAKLNEVMKYNLELYNKDQELLNNK